jgi:SHS2 domain-containing protein
MFELQGADLQAETTLDGDVQRQALDLETLLVAWLNDLLYLSEINDALYTQFDVQLTAPDDQEPVLVAHVAGVAGRGPLAHIKAVTFHDLSLVQTPSGWEATVTFDT